MLYCDSPICTNICRFSSVITVAALPLCDSSVDVFPPLNLLTHLLNHCRHPLLPPIHVSEPTMGVCSGTSIFSQGSLPSVYVSQPLINAKKKLSFVDEGIFQWYEFQTHNINYTGLTDKQALLSVQPPTKYIFGFVRGWK